jgi:hypothetical protein
MTVTRKQRDEEMESVGEVLSRHDPIHKPNELSAISQPLPQSSEEAIEWLRKNGAPEWQIVALQMAQDKRHDFAPHTLRLWIDKLADYPDSLVCRAMKQGRWEYFPSVDDVLKMADLLRERDAQEAGNRDWLAYKAQNAAAERDGRMATEEDYAEMRSKLRELFGDPTAKQTGK